MSSRAATPPLLFIDHGLAAKIAAEAETARTQIRRAKRYLTKCESSSGQRAHGDAHDAERTLDRILAMLRA